MDNIDNHHSHSNYYQQQNDQIDDCKLSSDSNQLQQTQISQKNQEYYQTAQPLLSIDQINDQNSPRKGLFQLKFHQDSIPFFESIPDNKDIKIISVIGRTGQGKSTLANLIVHSLLSPEQQQPTDKSFFKVGHGSEKITRGMYYYPNQLRRNADYNETIIICDLEGLDNDLLKHLTEIQRQSYKKCLIQLYSLCELFSSVIVYSCIDVRVAEAQLYDMLQIDYETKKYRKARRFFCLRDATQNKIKEFKTLIQANIQNNALITQQQIQQNKQGRSNKEIWHSSCHSTFNNFGNKKEQFWKCSFFNLFFEYIYLPRPESEDCINDDYHSEIKGKLGQQLKQQLNFLLQGNVLCHLSEKIKLLTGWEISYGMEIYVNMLNTINIGGLFLQIELNDIILNFEKSIKNRIYTLYNEQFLISMLLKQYRDIISRECMRFCLIGFQLQLQALLLKELDLKIQAKIEEHKIIRDNFDAVMNRNLSQESQNQFQSIQDQWQQTQQGNQNQKINVDFKKMLANRNERLEIREANLLSRKKTLQIREQQNNEALDIAQGDQCIAEEHLAIQKEETLILEEKAHLQNSKQAKHITDVTLVTLYCVGGFVAGQTLANFIHGKYQKKSNSSREKLSGKIACEMAVGTLIGTAFGVASTLTEKFGGAYAGFAFDGVQNIRVVYNIYKNKYIDQTIKKSELKKALVNTAIIVSSSAVSFLLSGGILLAISISTVNGFATQCFQNWLFKNRRGNVAKNGQNEGSAICCIINKQQEDGCWRFDDDQLLSVLNLNKNSVKHIKMVKDNQSIFINNYLSELKGQMNSQKDEESFPQIQYEYDDKSYTNDVRMTQLIVHIIGYYAIKEDKLEKSIEESLELALIYIEDFPVDQYIKPIFNTVELFHTNFKENQAYLIAQQIKKNDSPYVNFTTSIQKETIQNDQQLIQQQKLNLDTNDKDQNIEIQTNEKQNKMGRPGQWIAKDQLFETLKIDIELFQDSIPDQLLKMFKEDVGEATNLWLTLLIIQFLDPSFILTHCVERAIVWLSSRHFYLIDSLSTFQDLLRSMRHVYTNQ